LEKRGSLARAFDPDQIPWKWTNAIEQGLGISGQHEAGAA
jgi:hypothetical protein